MTTQNANHADLGGVGTIPPHQLGVDDAKSADVSSLSISADSLVSRELAGVSEQIVSVEAIPYGIKYLKPLKFASGSIALADNVLVKITTASGIIGIAEAPPRPYTYGETQSSIVAVIDQLFAPAMIGKSVFDREGIRKKMHATVGNPTAKAAVDMALWDAIGKLLGRSVHQLLGGYTDHLQVSHMLGFNDPQIVANEALELRETFGINSFKIKVGRSPIDGDVAVCKAVREALGDSAEIYLDGNRGWTVVESADALRRLEDVGLSRVEELNPADQVLSRKWLVERCPVLFVADESAPTAAEATRQITLGAANALSIKTARTGFTDSERVASLAEGLGVEVFIGNQIDAHLGTISSLVFGASRETTSRHAAELSNWLDLEDSLLTEPLIIEGGKMTVPQGPGLGVAIDEEKLAVYRLDK